jgi:YD repeat-containing protein
MTSFTGVNSATTTYSYDALRRPLNILYPDGGQHKIAYNVNLPPGQGNLVVQDKMDSRFDEHTIVYDGFGREIETQHNTDAGGTTYVDTAYDQNGHAWWVTNPYRSKSNPTSETTYGVTKTYYDALGRETSSVLSDGTSKTSTSYSGMPYAGGYGLSKTYTDPDGNRTVWASDALGLLGATVENSIGAKNLPALTTIYLYDGLNNLANVQQHGDGTNSSAFRNRTFGYDNLSRLTNSLNPETGAITYIYDKNSNLITKTDARNIVTTYKYDALNRLTSKVYNTSDLAHTPYSCYQYGTATGNTLERLTMEWTEPPSATPCVAPSNALTSRAFSAYDSRGRVLNEQQCYATSCGSNGYGYDLAGHLLDFGNLIGTGAFTNAYDSGGKLSSVSESWSENVGPEFPGTLFSGATYAPHGALTGATYGTNLSISRTYDSRLRILGETDLGTTVQQPATGGSVNLTITGGVQTK